MGKDLALTLSEASGLYTALVVLSLELVSKLPGGLLGPIPVFLILVMLRSRSTLFPALLIRFLYQVPASTPAEQMRGLASPASSL